MCELFVFVLVCVCLVCVECACVLSKNAPVCAVKSAVKTHVSSLTRAFCWHTRRRFECTHGGVFESTQRGFSACHTTHTTPTQQQDTDNTPTPLTDRDLESVLSKSTSVRTRKTVNYACQGHRFVEARGDTDGQIVRYTQVQAGGLFPSGHEDNFFLVNVLTLQIIVFELIKTKNRDHFGRDGTRLAFVRDGKQCKMKFLDADVKIPWASVSSIVDEGNVVVCGFMHREHEHRPEDSDEQEGWRVCGVRENDEDGEV